LKTISFCWRSRNALIPALVTLLGSVILLSGMIAPVFAVTLNEALDNSSLTFSTGGSATWFGQTSVYSYGGSAAQSGDISDGQTSWLSFQTPYVGSSGNYLRFDWKVSSEERFDMLTFYMDYVFMGSINGEVGWQQETCYIPAGYHTLEWSYEKDGSGSSGADAGWVDHVQLFSGWAAPTIGEAVDNTALTWSSFFSGYGEAWKGEPFISMYGGDAAQSGSVRDSSYSYLDTGVTGPGTLYFYWKVSSEADDYLIFYIDGVSQSSISGTIDWQQKSFNVASGYHTLRWSYKKDVGVSSGSDAGWLDQVEFVPTSVTLGEAVDNTGLTWSTFGSAHWFGQTSTSYYGGDAAQSGKVIDDAYTWIQTTVTGPGTLSFYWKVSSEAGYDYLEFYIDGALQSEISGEVNWQQKSFSLASGSHLLVWSYSKDRSVSTGSDAGWLDRVQVTSTGASAHIYIEHTYRGDLVVDIGVGNTASPLWSSRVWNRQGGSADNLDLTVDLSAATAYLPPSNTYRWFLKVYDAASGDQGKITQFSITYQGNTYTSTEVPVLVSDLKTSYAYIPSPAPIQAHVYIQHTYRGDLIVDIGVGSTSTPLWSKRVWSGTGGSADNLDLYIDLSSVVKYLPPSATYAWWVKVYDKAAGDTGKIVTFTITYQGKTYTSPDVPVPINDLKTSYAYIKG